VLAKNRKGERRMPKRKISPLTATKAQPQARAYLIWDSIQRGLALQVRPSGYKAFKLIYRHGNRPRWFHIAAADAIGLADARKIAAELMLEVIRGKDPAAERRTGRQAITFGTLAERYRQEYAMRKNKSWKQASALINRHVLPQWKDISAATITRSDVRALFGKITAPVLANQVLAATSAVFSWAVKQEIVTNNPVRGVERHNTTSRERVLSDAEVPQFWHAFDKAGLPGVALQVLLLTGQRPGEVSHMRLEHITDEWWELPGAPDAATGWPGTKNGQTHRVYLPAQVRTIIAALGTDTSGFVFGKPPLLDAAMRSICRELDVPRATPHDLRRTHGTTITKLGFGRPAMDRIQNHASHEIADVYDRHGYGPENQRIMEAVCQHLMNLIKGCKEDNVIIAKFST
jgi:integrase